MLSKRIIFGNSAAVFPLAAMLSAVLSCGGPGARWEKVAENLYLFRDCANVYALVDDGRALLVGFATGAALDHLNQIGADRVDMILVTHHHRDGLQGIGRAVEAGIDIVVPAAEAPLIESAAEHWRTKRIFVNYDGRSRFNAVTFDVPVSLKVKDGDSIRWGSYEIDVIELPGHTDGSVAYRTGVNGGQVLFAGDFYTSPGKTLTYYDLHWHYTMWDGFPEAIASAEKLRTLVPALVCPDHGPPFREEGGGVDQFLVNLRDLEDVFMPNNKDKSTLKRKPLDSFFGPYVVYIDGQTYAIVSDSRHAILFDPGYGDYGHLARFIRQYQIESIDAITFSHYHDDHLSRTIEDLYLWQGTIRPVTTRIWVLDAMADVFAHPGRYNIPCLFPVPIPIDRVIAEDEVVEWEGLKLTFKHFPGQTWYHAVVLFEAGGHSIALTGDSVWQPQDWSVRMNGPIIPRNRYFLGDGYERVFQILLDYKVDVIIPAHYDPFSVRRSDLERSLRWAESIAPTIARLVDQPHPGYGFDPHWAHFYPYRLELNLEEAAPVKSTAKLLVRNYFERDVPLQVELLPPPGVKVRPARKKAILPADSEGEFDFELTVDPGAEGSRRVLLADITLDGRYLGQVTEMVIDTPVRLPEHTLK